jgi:hypothetical protein
MMPNTLKDIVGHNHQSKWELLHMSHKAKCQRTEMELKYKAAEAEKACVHELQTLKLKIQLAQINSGMQMTSMCPTGSSEPSLPFRMDGTSLYGAGKSSGANTPYSMPDASGFGSGGSLSSLHGSSNGIDLSFDMYGPMDAAFPPLPSTYQCTYNTPNDTTYKLPTSSQSST